MLSTTSSIRDEPPPPEPSIDRRSLFTKAKSPPLPPKIHYYVNIEREKLHLPELNQSSSLDNIARMQALHMAQSCCVSNAFDTPEDLQDVLNSRSAGENVCRGKSIASLLDAMSTKTCLANILSNDYTEFGVGVATGTDGMWYVCQLFRSTGSSSSSSGRQIREITSSHQDSVDPTTSTSTTPPSISVDRRIPSTRSDSSSSSSSSSSISTPTTTRRKIRLLVPSRLKQRRVSATFSVVQHEC